MRTLRLSFLLGSLLALGACGALWAAEPLSVGVFDAHRDIGTVKLAGAAAYDAGKEEYILRGSGANMWGAQDAFHYAWKQVKGDFILQARVEFLGQGVEPHRKAGLIVRSSLDPRSPHLNVCRHGDGLTTLQYRRTEGGDTEEIPTGIGAADQLQIERKGNTFILSVARFGQPYTVRQITDLSLGAELSVGLYVCAHNNEVSETARFTNVRLIRPFPDHLVRYRDYLGSDVELLDTVTGRRRVIHHEADSIQAPNWTPDGKALILNRNGRIYRLDLAPKQIRVLDTGAAIENNNDHALSFDGRQMAISSGTPSRIYTVPSGGGTPRLITPTGPSYFHGWSPDGKWLSFTGERGGNYDIYLVPSEGGPEKRLTTAEGLDDGSEYTPDGKWIYFNSVRTGRMQIWRMKPDGSGQEQVTFDDCNNWFAHISPDGKTLVFITYGLDVAPGDHPFYQRVTLRRLSIEGGQPQVIAYLYGGQGSLNVNSWSPDNRTLAFVSNSGTFEPVAPAPTTLQRPGLQLWSLRQELEKDLGKSLDRVKALGFEWVETHSTYGLSPAEFLKRLDERGLRALSAHVSFERLDTDLPGVIAEAKALGFTYVVLPWTPQETFSEAIALDLAGRLNAWGAKLSAAGLKLGYHPHGHEFVPVPGGGTAFDLLMRSTRAEDVCFELDVFWATRAGADPVALLAAHPGRWKLLHVKELRRDAALAPGQRSAPVTDHVAVGQGRMDWKRIAPAAERAGIEGYFLEDETPDPGRTIPLSLEFLNSFKP
jgi:TolB protein